MMTVRTAVIAVTILTGVARPALQQPSAFDVRAFGAKGDGKTLDTDAINAAIAAAHKAGGGTVRLGAGTYLSTSIRLQRHVGLTNDKPDARPAFRFDDVAGVDLERLIVPHGEAPVFSLRSVTDFVHRNS